MKLGAVLLAAGAGLRMGGRPKCLLEWEGEALIRRQIKALRDARVGELVVVLGHHGPRILRALQGLPLRVVINPDPDAGQVLSLRTGLAALSPQVDVVLVALADQALIGSQDLKDLIAAYTNRPLGTEVVQPQVQGLPGNPVAFSAGVRTQILAGGAALGCKQWQLLHPERVHRWPSNNLRYRLDVDTPQDIDALAAWTGRRLCWPEDLADGAGVGPSLPVV